MIPQIRNLSLTWIRNNKDLALNFLLIGCSIFLFTCLTKERDKYEAHLKEDVKKGEEDLKIARQNFENSLLLLKSMDKK